MDEFDVLLTQMNSYRDEIIDIQRRLVAIPALAPESGGQGEEMKALYIEELLRKVGVDELNRYDASDDRVLSGKRPNLVAKIYGKQHDKTVWVITHMDVVPAGDVRKWNGDPFQLEVKDDMLIGRGTEDNHQGFVSVLMAVKALREKRVKPEFTIGLIIVADEETGSEYGLEFLMRMSKDLFKKEDWFLIPDAGDPQGVTIEVAEKSVYWLKFTTAGRQCHASTPTLGVNAMQAGAHLVVALEYLSQYFSEKDLLYDDPLSTFVPTKKELNIENINTVPALDIFYMDCRVLPCYNLVQVDQAISSIVEKIQTQFQVSIAVDVVNKAPAAPPTPSDAPVVKALSLAIKSITGMDSRIIGIGGGTVAAVLRKAGFHAVVWSTIADVCHQPNEYSLISNTINDAKIMLCCFMDNPRAKQQEFMLGD